MLSAFLFQYFFAQYILTTILMCIYYDIVSDNMKRADKIAGRRNSYDIFIVTYFMILYISHTAK